jgi:hypothetical protein
MVRVLQILVFSLVVTLLGGCNGSEEDKPIWERVKIGDLLPTRRGKGPSEGSLKTINFDVYVFEMPADNIGALAEVREMLYEQPFRFFDYNAFASNSFSVGFGQIRMWNEIGGLLNAAGAKKMSTVSLLLVHGQSNDLAITSLYREQPVFFVAAGGSMPGVSIGPGKLVLRIKAEKIPGSRGVCNVTVHPVFTPPTRSSIPELAGRAKAGELPFVSAGFRLKMSPGELFLLGPEKYISDQISLGGLFFSKPEGNLFFTKSESNSSAVKPERKPAIRVFLLVCTGMNV